LYLQKVKTRKYSFSYFINTLGEKKKLLHYAAKEDVAFTKQMADVIIAKL